MRCLSSISLIVIAVLAVSLTSCNTTGCTDNQSSIPLAGFYGSGNDRAISVDSIEIGGEGAPGDSLLTSGMSPVSSIYLPFRAADGNTTFFFRYRQQALEGLADYITFTYTATPYFASEECGAMYRYHITSCDYTTHLIDRVEILDSLVTNTDVERIKIYFRTADEDAD